MTANARFERSYWTAHSQYRKFGDYPQALAALRDWYQGLFRLIGDDLPAPGRAVDAGCGHGAIVHELLARGWDAHGFDASRWMIEQAQHTTPDCATRFAVGDLIAPPFDGDFDLVTCVAVLEHVPDPVAALRALGTRLRPAGRLIVMVPNLRPLMPWWDPVAADPTHISVHEPNWWRGALESTGLQVRRLTTFVALPVLWRVDPVFARCVPLGRRVGPEVLIVAS